MGVSAPELADQVANILEVKTSEKQEVLEILSVEDRLEKVLELLIHEIKVIELEKNIVNQAQAKFDKVPRSRFCVTGKKLFPRS